MTLLLDAARLEGVLSMRDAIDLLEKTLAHQAQGATSVSPKFTTDFEDGAIRILFAADSAARYCAMKAYHNIKGAGTRYVVLLYSLDSGEVLAILDGRIITDLRTGAASGVAARRVAVAEPVTIGIIGSGNQARTQLESLAVVYTVKSATVFSPTAAKREIFAAEMSEKLGFRVTPVDTARAAVEGHSVVATASNARNPDPVVKGEWLKDCRLLCAVGNTRRQFAEVDVQCFRDAALVIMDSEHALEEAGELQRAVDAGALPESKRATLAELITGNATVPDRGLVTFKSVGMALQDLALAARYYELLRDTPGVAVGPDVASLRPR
jgi:alanine dehydrogenase